MTDDSKFAIVSPKSVKLYAEIVSGQTLTDDLASSLAEDVTYRLRETLQVLLDKFTLLGYFPTALTVFHVLYRRVINYNPTECISVHEAC